MALPKEDIYTIEDIYALPDGERAELIDGQIYYMAPLVGNIRSCPVKFWHHQGVYPVKSWCL